MKEASVPADRNGGFVCHFDVCYSAQVAGGSGFTAVSRQLFTIVILTPRISPLELI
jgi:hypothetical protein